MSERVSCKTQAECDAALAAKKIPELRGDGWFSIQGQAYVEAWESSHVVARESSHVEARESSHVEAWESSHVEAWGSSHVVTRGSSHVVARESSHVEARESSHVVARESSHVVASKQVAVHQHSKQAKCKGGVVIVVKLPQTPKQWCEYYGAKIENGHAILFKAVRDDYRSAHDFLYQPGTTPKCEDWDGGVNECGGGLHFCASPIQAKSFDDSATRYVACPVKLSEIKVYTKNPSYPYKVKAPRVAKPIYEVNLYGEKLP